MWAIAYGHLLLPLLSSSIIFCSYPLPPSLSQVKSDCVYILILTISQLVMTCILCMYFQLIFPFLLATQYALQTWMKKLETQICRFEFFCLLYRLDIIIIPSFYFEFFHLNRSCRIVISLSCQIHIYNIYNLLLILYAIYTSYGNHLLGQKNCLSWSIVLPFNITVNFNHIVPWSSSSNNKATDLTIVSIDATSKPFLQFMYNQLA